MNNKPEPNRQGLQFSERQRWIIILLLLLLVEAACLSFTNLQHLFTKPTTEAVVPVSLEAKKRADYSVDLGDYLSPNINLSILVDILKELDLDEATLNARLATVTAMLAQPIPSATRPASAQTTGLAPTQTEAIIATPTPLPSPSATLAATASLPAQTPTTAALTPTKASTTQATSTKAYTQPAATSISVSRTPTATHKPTRTATHTVTGAPLGSATATLTPTSTQLAPATLTSTATLAATRTSTRTASATATATSVKTSTSTFTTTPTSVPAWTSTSTPTKTTTPVYTDTPTRTATSTPTGLATNTPTNTTTATPTPTGTQTPTNTPTSTNTLLPTLTDTPTVTPTSTELVPPTPTSTPTSTPTNSDCYAYPGNGFVPSQDAWINGNQPGQSYGTDTQLHIRPVNNADRRALIQFDLSSIPSGSTILSAVLYVNDETGEDYTVLIYPLAGVWDESVTWDTAPAFDPAAIGSFNLTLTPCVRAAWLDTARVNAWVNDPATNFGVLLYASGGAGEDLLSSREGALPARLVVDYLPPRGVGAGLHSISATITKDSLSNVAVQGPTPPDAARPGQPESSRRRR